MSGKNPENTSLLNGTAQQDRLLRALLPDYVKIDERTLSEKLAFASRFAGFLQYFNENNQPIGDWVSILAKDEVVLLANITVDAQKDKDDHIRSLIHQIIHTKEDLSLIHI